MSDPNIDLLPGKNAVCTDAPVTLDVLIRINPPAAETSTTRLPLNLAIVLDRSGSMAGSKKMPFAIEAASFAVTQLLATDRVSVTTFDDKVETIVPSTLAVDKLGIVARIKSVSPRGSTDLHGGWAEGGCQAETNRLDGALNRVFLLSDGQANVGITLPSEIADQARALTARGVSTTTMGVGDDYNEDLMEAMAKAGDGNYYLIESPVQLTDIFQTEMRGLMATVGQKVSLGLEPVGDVAVAEVLNILELAPTGRFMLPNLIRGMPILITIRLNVPPMSVGGDLLSIRLAWDDAKSGARRVQHAVLNIARAVPISAWSEIVIDPTVQEQVGLQMIGRAQKEAAEALDRGDRETSRRRFESAQLYARSMPSTPEVAEEVEAITKLANALDAGDDQFISKLAKFRSYGRGRGRAPAATPPAPTPESKEPKP